MKNKRFVQKQNLLYVILLIPALVYLGFGFLHGIAAFSCDGYLRWEEDACLLHGIYPMDIVLGRRPVTEVYTYFNNTTTTIPWSYLLSNLFYPGWVSWTATKYWALFVFVAMATFTGLLQILEGLLMTFFLLISYHPNSRLFAVDSAISQVIL